MSFPYFSPQVVRPGCRLFLRHPLPRPWKPIWKFFVQYGESCESCPRIGQDHVYSSVGFHPVLWIVWNLSTRLGPIRYSNNRPCGARASHPRSYLLLRSRPCIVVELGMIFSRHVQFDSRFNVMTVNVVPWERPEIVSCFTIIRRRVLKWWWRPVWFSWWGCPELRWMFSEPDLLQRVWLFHLRLEYICLPFWGVNTSFALSLPAWVSDAFIFSNSSMSATKMSSFQNLPAVRLSGRTDAVATGLW